MNEFKQLHPKEGIELLAVKVPEGASLFKVTDRLEFDELDQNSGMQMPDYIMLPEGNWQIVGISDQLTEEQCREVMPVSYLPFPNFDPIGFEVNDELGTTIYNTAKEAFESLMQSERCYSENPYGPDLCEHNRQCYDSCQGSCWTRADIDSEEWQAAEANTGSWLIIKKTMI